MDRNKKSIIVNHRLFDGIENRLHDNRSIVIENGRIRSIEERLILPEQTEFNILDLKGMTLLPGLIDNHVHISLPFVHTATLRSIIEGKRQIRKNLRCCIRSGVTTVRDTGAIPGWIDYSKAVVKKDITAGPRILTTYSAITEHMGCPDWVPYLNFLQKFIAEGEYKESPRTPQEAEKLVERMINKGADWIKIYYQSRSWSLSGRRLPVFDRETFSAIMKTAADHGKKVCCHVVFLNDLEEVISNGISSTEHSIIDNEIPDRIIEEYLIKSVAVLPTLTYLELMGNRELKAAFSRIVCEKGSDFLEPESIRQIKEFYDIHLNSEYPPVNSKNPFNFYDDVEMFNRGYPVVMKNFLKMHKAGVRIGVGSDSGGSCMSYFGTLYPEELIRMAVAGMSNYEVLKAATSVNAEILDMSDIIGSIGKGKLADLVAVEGNPLDDISVMRDIKMVFKEGNSVKMQNS